MSIKIGDRVRVIKNSVLAHKKDEEYLEPGDIITIVGFDALNRIVYNYPITGRDGNQLTARNCILASDVVLVQEELPIQATKEPECRCDSKYILHGMHEKGCAYKAWRDSCHSNIQE